jgi:pimeloyl-ACP methyl ester carboxylesterase
MTDTVLRYFQAGDEDRLMMAVDDALAPELRRYFGDEGYDRVRGLAGKVIAHTKAGHLGPNAPKNLIFVPGIMGSLLMPKEFGGVWWVDALRNRDKIDKLGLNPAGDDVNPHHAIEAFQVDQTYDGFLNAVYLREDDDFGYVRFPFDWRKSLWKSTDALKTKIEELCVSNVKEVHLVGHSMGGLLIRAMLARHGDEVLWNKIGRIIFIGTPHYGTPAMAFYLKKHFYGTDLKLILALVLSRSTFRSLYGALSLLPAPRGIYPGTRTDDRSPWRPDKPDDRYVHPCANFDLYNAEAWNLGTDAVETGRLQHILDHVRDFYSEITGHHFKTLNNEHRAKMAMIVGMGQPTPFRLTIDKGWFGIGESVQRITRRVEGNPHREGDGSVPLASACLESIGTTRYALGEHSVLPNIPMVYNDVFAWLGEEKKEKMQLSDSPEGALAGHLGPSNAPSDTPELDGANDPLGPGPHGRWDPDLQLTTPPEQVLKDLEAGKYPQFHRVRIM